MTRRARAAGFTLLEVTISSVVLVVILGTAMTTIHTGRQASNHAMTQIDLEDEMRQALTDFATDVRWASKTAEDTNNNDKLDAGEDANGNGRLEDDWFLTTTSITFNVRQGAGFNQPITYRKNGDNLERIVQMPNGRSSTTVIARGVQQFDLSESAGTVTVAIAMSATTADGAVISRNRRISVTMRN